MPTPPTLENLLDEIASDSPTPGGGSVAALSGSLGASLVSMVCNLSIGKKKFADVEDELKNMLDEAQSLRRELVQLSKDDVDAFNDVMAAFKTPDDEGKAERLQKAYKGAAVVPLKTAHRCLRVMELAESSVQKGNKNAITDAGVGALMAYSGLKGALFNVKVNLREITDDDFVAEKSREIVILEDKGQDILNRVLNGLETYLAQ